MRGSVAGLAVLAGLLGAALMAPGTASATSAAQCVGETTFTDEIPGTPRGLEYEFLCNETIYAFSVIANKQLIYFSPELTPFDHEGNGTGELVQCEGPQPGFGFGCRGRVIVDHVVVGLMSTLGAPCSRRGRDVRAWLVVTTAQATATGGSNLVSSAPFRLKGPECPSPPAPRRKR